MVVIVFFRCSFFEHFQSGKSIGCLLVCVLSPFSSLFSIRHRVLTPRNALEQRFIEEAQKAQH